MSKNVKVPVLVLLAAASALAGDAAIDRARQLYNSTDFDQSLRILQAVPQKSAEVEELVGLNHFMLADYKKATDALEKAVAAEPSSSAYNLWLARAYGRRAETSSFLTAPGFASKSRQHFEKAVELDPTNLDAMNDLLDYYLEAPGFLGGSMDKAKALAVRIGAVSARDGDSAEARVAEKHKEYSTAEAHLRHAAEIAPQRVGVFLELAHFLVRQGRVREADQNIAHAEKIAPDNPRVVYAKADILIRTNRNLDQAQQLLERYLSLDLTPDDPPRTDARKLLKKARGS
jgi:tetratricopeptide (TPR) repeat protein